MEWPPTEMKIKDKRNHNKIKTMKRTTEFRDAQKVYSQPHGPYKVVSVVSLGGECEEYFKEYASRDNGNLFYSKKHRINFLFQMTEELNEFQLGYICRTSDIVVFFIDSTEIDDNKLKIIKRFIPTCIFCVSNQKLKPVAKRFVEKHFPKEKIVEIGGLMDSLNTIRTRNTSVCRRPYMVPTRVYSDGEYIYAEGLLRKGFLSDKVIANGKYEMIIEEVVADRVYRGSELNVEADIESNVPAEGYDMEYSEESLMSMCEEKENYSEKSDEDSSLGYGSESEESSPLDDQLSLIDKYSEYRGIRNFSTCEFKSHNFPSNYKDLLFFDEFKRVEKLIAGRESVIPDDQMVKVKLRYEGLIEEEIRVFFGCYEYEDKKTIYNFHFDSETPLKEEDLVVDLGHKVVEVSPMLTKNLSQKVFKRQDELDSGIISFIAPISFNISRVLIYKKSVLNELSSNTFVSVGLNGFIGDRAIFDEVILKGMPTKTKKRYSLIKRMFNTKEEVMYFRNIQLHINNKKVTGFIKKPIGTHGLFKGYFTQPIKPGDQVLMSLYKRVFLKN